MPDTILLIDDDTSLCRVMEFTLKQAGYLVFVALSGKDGLKLFKRHRPKLIIADVKMPVMTGFQLLTEVQKIDEKTLLIFITGYSSIPNAVTAIKSGAYDYLTKPFSKDQLCRVVKSALEFQNRCDGKLKYRDRVCEINEEVTVIGQSPDILSLITRIAKIARSQASVLICGESGTGKEIIARMLHQKSDRAHRPFVAINCAAIPKDLLEAELFGHTKGAFTHALKDRKGKFSLADKGTLFLDEVGELPLNLQPKLLRALQEQIIEPIGGNPEQVDVRIVAATNRNIDEALIEGRFREDLYYRLAVIPIHLPPLRERKEDIPLLIDFFLNKMKILSHITFANEVMIDLLNYDWPGNVRELENVIEQIMVLRCSNVIQSEDLPQRITKGAKFKGSIIKLPKGGYPLEDIEREAIVQALHMCKGNKTHAAKLLHISRDTLNYRIEKHNLKFDLKKHTLNND